jgi:hypothetical protein
MPANVFENGNKYTKDSAYVLNRNTIYGIRFRQQICFIDIGKIYKNINRWYFC